MLKEIISHSLDENRGVIYTNIIVSKEEIEKELDYDEYENDSVILQRNLNPLELEYGLSEYLKDNPSLVEF